MLDILKFPEVMWHSRRLVWDTRQSLSLLPECVFIWPELTPQLQKVLRQRPHRVECVEGKQARRVLGERASEAYGHPSRQLKVIGVTGTNGKTTCAQMIARLLACAGESVAEIGTLGVALRAPGNPEVCERQETGFTTPEAPTLQAIFRQCVDLGITAVVMEVSSHSLVLERVAGTEFRGALFTNLSQDHLDFHKNMNSYEAAKAKLFKDVLQRSSRSEKPVASIHTGDPAGARLLRDLQGAPLRSRGYEEGKNFWVRESSVRGLTLELADFSGQLFHSPLLGHFNAENLVGAFETVRALFPEFSVTRWRELWQQALENFSGATGRLERVTSVTAPFHVFVDYAHTPDALKKTLETLRSYLPSENQLTVVFGCGGDRDAGKRPLMGAIAGELADRVYLTSDNPRTEQPAAILQQILEGVTLRRELSLELIEDRKRAIESALQNLRAGDLCVIAGKGHEDYQIIGTQKKMFSDQAVVRAFFAQH